MPRGSKIPDQLTKFSLLGEGDPACLPQMRLMKAGDVELNPGLSSEACNEVIKRNPAPWSCGTCGRNAHAACTGLTRPERKESAAVRTAAETKVPQPGRMPVKREKSEIVLHSL